MAIQASDGSALNPSITNIGDTNTGIFFPAEDSVAISEGGTEILRVSNNGNTGIGTTTPSSKLHIVGSMPLEISNTINNNEDKSGRLVTTHYSISEEPVGLIGGSSTGTFNTVRIGGGYSSVNAATDIFFYTASNNTTPIGSIAMKIDSQKRVMVGDELAYSTSPLNLTTDINGSVYISLFGFSNPYGIIGLNHSSGSPVIGYGARPHPATGYGDGLWKSTVSGNNFPRAVLDVGKFGTIRFFTSGNQNIPEGGDITIPERMIITSSGRVGIGTSSPSCALDVSGQISGLFTNVGTNIAAQNLSTNKVSQVTISASTTLTTTIPPNGSTAIVIIVTSGTTSRTVTFGTGFASSGTLATGVVSGVRYTVSFVSDGTRLIETSRTGPITV